MLDESHITELVERVLETGAEPEAVCIADPELLSIVKERVALCQRVSDQLGELFPPSRRAETRPQSGQAETLPTIAGYDVQSILGRGGIGIVYMARHLKLGRPVAVKMLLAGDYASPSERSRFQREGRAIAALRHPHIVQIHDVGDCDGRPFYTMELVEAGTLAHKIDGKPRPACEAAALVITLASAVQTAHDAGIVHCDLKPANVLMASDGTPKISDFGLARMTEIDVAVTLGSDFNGTPAYMAPEQAAGVPEAAERSVDIYALGVILYEMLVGRPPFRALTAAATYRQVINDAPIRPRQINGNVPRDLETICLKCLEKSPGQRYATAALLADDLQRFLRGEPIIARRTGIIERAAKWTRRRPAVAIAIAASGLLAIVVATGLWRYESNQAARLIAINADLTELANYETAGQWIKAKATLDRAQARVDDGAPADVGQKVDVARNDLELVSRLDAIHLSRATSGGLAFYRQKADHDYAAAFEHYGLLKVGEPVESAAVTITSSAVHRALTAALDDWAFSAMDPPRRDWLAKLAARTEPVAYGSDPRVRDPAIWADLQATQDLCRTLKVTDYSVSSMLALSDRLAITGRDASAFLKRLQQEHPADFWINLSLGNVLLLTAPEEAGIYYRAALAARPEAAVSYCAVGDSLRLQHQPGEAVDYYHKALRFDPAYARAQNNLGKALRELGRTDEAIACHEATLRLDPNYAWAHFDLAFVRVKQNRLAEALEQFKIIAAASPQSPEVQAGYRIVMMRLGRGQQVKQEWKQLLESSPGSFDAWGGYAELCLYLGDETEYRQARTSLLQNFGNRPVSRVAEPIARACLLLPANPKELAQATALANFAERTDAVDQVGPHNYYAYSLFAKGLAAYRNGQLDDALDAMAYGDLDVLGPCPGLVSAMALNDKGDHAGALLALDSAEKKFDWNPAHADRRDFWIYHVLRREAEAKIRPK